MSKLTRQQLRKMILQEMSNPGRNYPDPETGFYEDEDIEDVSWEDHMERMDDNADLLQGDDSVKHDFEEQLAALDREIVTLIASEDPNTTIQQIMGLPELLQDRTDIEMKIQLTLKAQQR